MADKLNPIVFSTDHNYVMPTCVTIHSLLTTAKTGVNYDIYVIIDPDVTEEDKNKLRKQVEVSSQESKINFLEIGNTFDSGFEIRDISRACYNRLMIPWFLPQYEKVVYSDVDIIFTGDISEVYDIDVQSELVAGVGGKTWTKGLIKKYLVKIGANPAEYINSGFLLINAKAQREENLKEKYLELSKKKFIYQDQDIINLVCKGRISKLPETYNVNPAEYYKYEPGTAKVVHYFGFKPWNHFTYSWILWWNVYNGSVVYDGDYSHKVSAGILRWNGVIETKKKAFKQKVKFLQQYIKA